MRANRGAHRASELAPNGVSDIDAYLEGRTARRRLASGIRGKWLNLRRSGLESFHEIGMEVPSAYASWLRSQPRLKVEYGCGGIGFFSREELQDAQVGYSIDPEGRLLCGESDGLWNPNWMVIGSDLGCGDPIFIDTSQSGSPVFTAMHGQGFWRPELIATTLELFSRMLDEYGAMAQYRSGRDGLEEDDLECSEFIEKIKKIDSGTINADFWLSMLAY